jgi:hypothetical protein
MPNFEFPSLICRLLTSARVSIGDNPLFSAKARGTASRAAENARMAYCSIEGIWGTGKRQGQIQLTQSHTSSAALETAIAQLMSAAPPPYTTRLSTTRLRTTQIASWRARLASSTIYKNEPNKLLQTKMMSNDHQPFCCSREQIW